MLFFFLRDLNIEREGTGSSFFFYAHAARRAIAVGQLPVLETATFSEGEIVQFYKSDLDNRIDGVARVRTYRA